jgi:thiol-disulfide isomerase/thioredoxin
MRAGLRFALGISLCLTTASACASRGAPARSPASASSATQSSVPTPADPLDPTGIDLATYGAPGEDRDLLPVPGPGKLTIFDFRADWCRACHQLDPVLLALARAYPDRVAIRRIEIVDWESPASLRYLVPTGTAIPHLKVMDERGTLLLERTTDGRGPRPLVEAIRQLLISQPSL